MASSQMGLTPTEAALQMSIAPESDLLGEIKVEVIAEMESVRGTIRKQRTTEAGVKERLRCMSMLGRICGIMGMKRETHSLAVHYMDQFLMHHVPPSLKLLTLGSLTLAIKMDDA